MSECVSDLLLTSVSAVLCRSCDLVLCWVDDGAQMDCVLKQHIDSNLPKAVFIMQRAHISSVLLI